jgi:tetratricopeptide (TPR) repeat protein
MFGQYVHFRRFAPKGNDYSLDRYRTQARRVLDVIETRLATVPFLGGEQYSIADIATFPWARNVGPLLGKDVEPKYQKALSIDSHFNPSHFGISADLMYQGKALEASAELQTMVDQARNDGETRTALFGMAVVAADAGKLANAVQQIEKEYAVAEKKNDVAAMAADLQAKGNILEEAQKYDAAAQQFERSLQLLEGSNLSQDIKDNAKRLHHFNLAALSIGKKDYAAAKTHAEEFRNGAEAHKNSLQLKQAHELAGRIALAEKDYDTAIAELQLANAQNPRNLYRLAQAYQAKGDSAKAQEYAALAAGFNSLPQFNYAFIRVKAQKMLSTKQG